MFILCLIFDQTKSLFQRWLLYGIGTLFSIAMLYVVTSIVLKLTLNVAIALWGADVVNGILDTGSEGFSSQAMQQGGIGLLLAVLIISVPPMAAMFFQGTVGQFMHFSAFGGGIASRPGPQGQPPGSYGGGYGGSSAPLQLSTTNVNSGGPVGTGGFANSSAGTRGAIVASTTQFDTIKNQSAERGSP